MTGTSGVLFWLLYTVGIASIAASAVAYWLRATRRYSAPLLVAALGSLTWALIVRSFIAGRLPVIGTFENTLVTAVMILATALWLAWRGPLSGRSPFLGLLGPAALIVLMGGLFAPIQPLPIDAGGRTVIGYIHAFVGWLDFALLVASVAAALGLLANRNEADEAARDEALVRTVGSGFALLTATMVSGSLYSFILFGDWYRWQVVETAAAVAWLAYAAILHLRLLHRWKGRKLAYATLGAFPLAVLAFWVWAVYPDTYHYFDAVLRVR